MTAAIAFDTTDAPVARLFGAHADFVWRTLRHFGVDETALDDAVQDVFVTAHRRWSSFEGRSSERTWLFGIARRVAFRYRRRAETQRRRYAPATDVGHDPLERVHAARSLAALLATLDRDKRAVFVLCEIEEMTAPEVADALDIPVGTVYSRLRVAWLRLAAAAGEDRERLQAQVPALRTSPPEDRRRRMWTGIAAGLPSASTLVATGGTITKWVLVTALASGAGLVVVTRTHPASAIGTPDATVRFESAPVVATARDDRSEIPRSAAPEPRPAIDIPEPPGNTSPPPRRVPAPARAPAITRDDAEPTPPDDVLGDEVSLLGEARKAMRAGDPARALANLEEHARRFPSGQLHEERDRTRALALCALGRRDEANALADRAGQPRPAC